MKFEYNSIELEVKAEHFRPAADRLVSVANEGQGVMDALLILLLIRHVDKVNPGAGQMILSSVEAQIEK